MAEEAQDAADDFVAEARLHAGLRHRHVLTVLGLVTGTTRAEVEAEASSARRARLGGPKAMLPGPAVPTAAAEPTGAAPAPAPVTAILMELCPGGSLWDQVHHPQWRGGDPPEGARPRLLPPGRLATAVVAALGADVARGLAYLHAFCPPLLHRDLKSANVLCRGGGAPSRGLLPDLVLADFGMARAKARLAGSATMTSGLGTLQWTAPEVLQSDRYSEAADIFSAGVVLWELSNRGQVPWHGLTQASVALAVCKGQRPPLDGTRPRLEGVIARCWHADPRCRPDAAELVGLLGDLAGQGR